MNSEKSDIHSSTPSGTSSLGGGGGETVRLSLLIAVYNSAPYLRQCLDSLIAQDYAEWEAVCIDDCSTDSSLDILNEYAAKDSRFKVVHLDQNQGQAKARNIGIGYCTGQLVCFLDSDDWLSRKAIRKAVTVFEDNPQADCVLFNCVRVFPDHEEEIGMDVRFPLTGEEAFRQSLDWSIHGIYMTRMDIQRSIPYDDVCRSFSDDNTTRLHYLASREVHMSDGIYYYRQNPKSVSHVIDISRFNFLIANTHMQRMLEDMHQPADILNLHQKVRWLNLIGCYRLLLRHPHSFTNDEHDYALQLMHDTWADIDTSSLPAGIKYKPGYAALPSWWMFQMQQKMYMNLKSEE